MNGHYGMHMFDVEASAHAAARLDATAGLRVSAQYKFKDSDYHAGVAINADGTLLATASHRPNQVVVRTLPSGEVVARLDEGQGLPLGLHFDDTSKLLLWTSHIGVDPATETGQVLFSAAFPSFGERRVWPCRTVANQSLLATAGGLLLYDGPIHWVDTPTAVEPIWSPLLNSVLAGTPDRRGVMGRVVAGGATEAQVNLTNRDPVLC